MNAKLDTFVKAILVVIAAVSIILIFTFMFNTANETQAMVDGYNAQRKIELNTQVGFWQEFLAPELPSTVAIVGVKVEPNFVLPFVFELHWPNNARDTDNTSYTYCGVDALGRHCRAFPIYVDAGGVFFDHSYLGVTLLDVVK